MFTITNSSGTQIPREQLDNDIKEYLNTQNPRPAQIIINNLISSPFTWDNIFKQISHIIGEKLILRSNSLDIKLNAKTLKDANKELDYWHPYINLFNHWINKGYQIRKL